MSNQQSNTHAVVMRRVRTIHRLRPLFSSATVAGLLFVVSLYAVGREVWVARVFQNMPHIQDVAAVIQFFLSAFLSTSHVVQLTLLLTAFALAWFITQVGKLTFHISPRYA